MVFFLQPLFGQLASDKRQAEAEQRVQSSFSANRFLFDDYENEDYPYSSRGRGKRSTLSRNKAKLDSKKRAKTTAPLSAKWSKRPAFLVNCVVCWIWIKVLEVLAITLTNGGTVGQFIDLSGDWVFVYLFGLAATYVGATLWGKRGLRAFMLHSSARASPICSWLRCTLPVRGR